MKLQEAFGFIGPGTPELRNDFFGFGHRGEQRHLVEHALQSQQPLDESICAGTEQYLGQLPHL